MPKQTRKSKDEVKAALEHQSKINRAKTMARMIYPAVEKLGSIYEAQTVFNAASGHIKYGLSIAEGQFKVNQLEVDLKTGAESPVKSAVKAILKMLEEEPAREAEVLLETMGRELEKYVAIKGLKGPMTDVPMNEFIA